jgi:acyl-coenzyme A thioesterase PaaI-like protein
MAVFTIEQANAILAENFAPWVLASGVTTEAVGAEAASLRIPFSEELCRIGGILCGQALLTGADTAMVIALAAASGGFKPCTTVDLTINYAAHHQGGCAAGSQGHAARQDAGLLHLRGTRGRRQQAGGVRDRHLRHPGVIPRALRT